MNTPIRLEKLLAMIIIAIAVIYIPIKLIAIGYSPVDDANRHVAFSMTERNWSEIILIAPGLESDHNAGWHTFLKAIRKCFNLKQDQLLHFSIIFLFFLFNFTGALTSPNCAAWFINLLILFNIQRNFFDRNFCGRPFIISCAAALILMKLWFEENKNQDEKPSKFSVFFISFVAITISVWLHGTWYSFLLLPTALLLAGKLLKSIELTSIIAVSTLAGAYLTGNFNEFLHFHYQATLNIFSEKIYNWQLVTEFSEGIVYYLWLAPVIIVTMLHNKVKKSKLNELSRDPVFILILLSWLLSLKVTRFWFDWGLIALLYWLSSKISDLIAEMKSVKTTFVKYLLFIFIIGAAAALIPQTSWDERNNRQKVTVDFSKASLSAFTPEEGGIIYNDTMTEFYANYYKYPEAKYRYILGFEPAIMPVEDREIFRNITYTNYHYSAYKPWINKLTPKDRIFTCMDISKYYSQLDWVKVSSRLWIGKLKDRNG